MGNMSLGAATAMKKNPDKGGNKRHRKRNRKVVEQQAKY